MKQLPDKVVKQGHAWIVADVEGNQYGPYASRGFAECAARHLEGRVTVRQVRITPMSRAFEVGAEPMKDDDFDVDTHTAALYY